jgi:hypothetical protein
LSAIGKWKLNGVLVLVLVRRSDVYTNYSCFRFSKVLVLCSSFWWGSWLKNYVAVHSYNLLNLINYSFFSPSGMFMVFNFSYQTETDLYLFFLLSFFCSSISFSLLSLQRLYYLLCFMSQKTKGGILFIHSSSGKIWNSVSCTRPLMDAYSSGEEVVVKVSWRILFL